jgi:acetyl/propionyl-CoA carboxylase alpha subunit
VIVGQVVKENDSLLILETMKMENSFLSPGTIKIRMRLLEELSEDKDVLRKKPEKKEGK